MDSFPQRVLLAVDGSQQSARARDAAARLVAQSGAELHLLHVAGVSHWTNPDIMNEAQLARIRSAAQQILDEQRSALTDQGTVITASYLRMGRATDEILRLRDEIEADLIVLGNRGLNAFQRVMLGSDAEGVVRHAPCAVLLIRKES